ncbi:DUF4440 domain-containing protein [Sorangium sp. So ce131]|uniref:DUF4440 domain-containing protein n=1 Tax=Sorangium sp. So ce131 TaxID=3133282 RepID=UPI003F628FA5
MDAGNPRAVDDKRAIDAVVRAFFQAFTNKGGERPDLQLVRALFIPVGLIVKTCSDVPTAYSLRQFIEPREKLLSDGILTDFVEEELWERTELFGNVAQRFCLYRKSGVLRGERFETRGMKSMQLVRTPEGWKICSIAWDDEREGVAIPQEQAKAEVRRAI